jgi:hypothetical protein
MDTHQNAPMTPKAREAVVRFVIDGSHSQAAERGRDLGSTHCWLQSPGHNVAREVVSTVDR